MAASGPQPPLRDAKDLELDSIPLFMKTLPEEESFDPALGALQALAYEGTPDEVALNFKDQGNDYFKGKRVREAADFYTQGINAKPTDQELLEVLYLNRAACNLQLENYRMVLQDCAKALAINQNSVKGLYRSATALYSLGRFVEAIDCIDRCLVIDSDNEHVKALRVKAAKSLAAKQGKDEVRAREEKAKADAQSQIQKALKERNIYLVSETEKNMDSPYQPSFDPEDKTSMFFPVFFLYPQYAMSDTIAEYQEQTTFSAHLAFMFPPEGQRPEWDKNGEYTTDNLVVYAITKRKRLLKIGKKMTLRDIFAAASGKAGVTDGMELKNGCLSFVVLPKGEVEADWVQKFKRDLQ